MTTPIEAKLFLWTFDRDQIRIKFKWREEAEVFEEVLKRIETAIAARYTNQKWTTKREAPIKGFKFLTTLQTEIASEHASIIMSIVGLSEFVVRGKDDVVSIIPLPAHK